MNESVPAGNVPAHEMSLTDLAQWGMPDVAYVRLLSDKDGPGWSIHAADGTPMGVAPSRDIAFAAIRQHELEPLSVH